MKTIIAAIAVVILVGAGYGFSVYNSIVTKDEQIGNQMAHIQSDLQRRYDLIPNLVNIVKGYASHEKEIFTQVADARAKLMGGGVTPEASKTMESALSRLLAISERYPDLKANRNFLELQAQLEGTENRINVSRKRYNDAINDYNSQIRRFPGNLFGFQTKPYYEIPNTAAAQKAPEIKF